MERRDRGGAGSHISRLPAQRARSGRPLRILVIGAGGSGISVARGLLRDGHDVTVFDQRADTRAGGGAITIWSNGETVLRQLGVDTDGAGQPLSSVRLLTSQGHRVATVDVDAMVRRLGAAVRMIPRRVLLERLLVDFPADHIRCNARAIRVVTMPDGVAVGFEDDSVAEGDLLIGADALHSVIRDVVGAPAAQVTGWCSWQGLVSLPEIADRKTAFLVIGSAGNTGLWPTGGANAQWWFDLPWSHDVIRPQRPIEAIRSTFAGWSDAVDLVLAKLTDDDLAQSPYPHFRHPVPAPLDAGPVTLLGDAAHTMPPRFAQGTNQALLDTMVLCKAISGLDGGSSRAELSRALRAYEKTRRRQVSVVSRVASLQVSHRESVLRPAAYNSEARKAGGMTRCCGSCSTPQVCKARNGGHGLSVATGIPRASGRLNTSALTMPYKGREQKVVEPGRTRVREFTMKPCAASAYLASRSPGSLAESSSRLLVTNHGGESNTWLALTRLGRALHPTEGGGCEPTSRSSRAVSTARPLEQPRHSSVAYSAAHQRGNAPWSARRTESIGV